MAEKKTNESEFFTYKNRPLVRCGDVIYYGSMAEKYVIKMEIKSKKKQLDLEVADKVTADSSQGAIAAIISEL